MNEGLAAVSGALSSFSFGFGKKKAEDGAEDAAASPAAPALPPAAAGPPPLPRGGGKRVVVIAFEAGPLGLKLLKEKQSGFVLIDEASGQAAQKGLGSGDRLMKVEEEFLPIGIDQHGAAQKITAYPRPVKLTFQKEGGLGGISFDSAPGGGSMAL
jgi:hypothetical protein